MSSNKLPRDVMDVIAKTNVATTATLKRASKKLNTSLSYTKPGVKAFLKKKAQEMLTKFEIVSIFLTGNNWNDSVQTTTQNKATIALDLGQVLSEIDKRHNLDTNPKQSVQYNMHLGKTTLYMSSVFDQKGKRRFDFYMGHNGHDAGMFTISHTPTGDLSLYVVLSEEEDHLYLAGYLGVALAALKTLYNSAPLKTCELNFSTTAKRAELGPLVRQFAELFDLKMKHRDSKAIYLYC